MTTSYLHRVRCPRDGATRPTIENVTVRRLPLVGWDEGGTGPNEAISTTPRGVDETDYVETPDGKFELPGIIVFDDLDDAMWNELKYAQRAWDAAHRKVQP